MTAKASRRVDIHQTITDQIIAAVETGTGPTEMPWHRSGSGITQPVNVESGKPYRGINTVALWAAAITGSFSNGFWGTYRQWQERGAQVRKGEKSSLIVFYKELEVAEGDADEGKSRHFVAKASHVFNAAQVDGYTAPELDQTTDPIDPIVAADRFIRATGAVITEGGESAFYHRTHDTITMPDRFRFKDTTTSTATESWYAVLLHELTHNAAIRIMPVSVPVSRKRSPPAHLCRHNQRDSRKASSLSSGRYLPGLAAGAVTRANAFSLSRRSA
ncbi:ArdC family protein [Stappia sp.]|uniref:ArdC family protein n=1 Tax=Stappia sp. TaxID=1870903 RepID=UPI003D0DEBCD